VLPLAQPAGCLHSSAALPVGRAAAEQGEHSVVGGLSSRLHKTAVVKYFVELNQPPAHLP